jgi:hypothetical protein
MALGDSCGCVLPRWTTSRLSTCYCLCVDCVARTVGKSTRAAVARKDAGGSPPPSPGSARSRSPLGPGGSTDPCTFEKHQYTPSPADFGMSLGGAKGYRVRTSRLANERRNSSSPLQPQAARPGTRTKNQSVHCLSGLLGSSLVIACSSSGPKSAMQRKSSHPPQPKPSTEEAEVSMTGVIHKLCAVAIRGNVSRKEALPHCTSRSLVRGLNLRLTSFAPLCSTRTIWRRRCTRFYRRWGTTTVQGRPTTRSCTSKHR